MPWSPFKMSPQNLSFYPEQTPKRAGSLCGRVLRRSRWQAAIWLATVALLLLSLPGQAQSFLLRYANTTSGAITFTGNSLGLAKATGTNQPGTLDSIGAFITLDTTSRVGNYPAGTTLNWTNNSSAAMLRLPTNSTVLYAELVWAGSAQIASDAAGAGNVLASLNTPVKFIMPDGTTNYITPDPATGSLVTNGTSAIFYVRSADVTSLVQAYGAGTYAAGGVPGTDIAAEDANNACGWSLAVVYQNQNLLQRNLSLFIGNSFAVSGGNPPSPVSVSGFCAPPTGTVHARLYVSAVEGDASKTGDQMKFGPSTNALVALSGTNNLVNNFFASQINNDNGVLDTSGTFGFSNSVPPSIGFSARQGWDITSVDISGILTNSMTTAYAQNVTSGDGYSLNLLGLQIDVGAPVLNTTQSVDKASTFVGDALTYTVVVTNSGTADAINLTFTDLLPFGTSFVPNTFTTNGIAINGANPVNGVPVPLIKQGSSMTFTYQAQVNQIPPSARFVTAATITYQYTGACAYSPIINGTLINQNVVTLVPLLAVSKQASLSNVIPGATMTYTIDVPNIGTTNTTGTTLIDQIPAGVSYVTNTTTLNGSSVPDISSTNMPFTVAHEIHGPGRPAGEIDVGDTAVVTFQVKISTNPPTRLNNSATIYADGIQPTTAQNAAANVDPVYSDLAAGISGTPNPVEAGDPISYTISVTNKGPDSLNIITNFITLYLPVSQSIESPTYTPASGTYNPLNGVWSGITMPSNGVVTMTVSGLVSPSLAASNVISSVTVSPPPGVLDIVTNNNTASTTNDVIKVADLTVTMDDGVTNILRGSAATFTVTVINLGPSTVDSLTLSNSFASYLTNFTVYPSEGTYDAYNDVWDGLVLGPGDSVSMTVLATVQTNALGAYTNYATVGVRAGVTDPVLSNNTATNVNVVYTNLTADLGIGKSAPATVLAGGSLAYTISITNFGPFTASNTVVTDSLPASVSFVSASGGGVNNSGTVTWNLGSIADNVVSNLTVTVTAPASGTLTNLASLATSTTDPVSTNNTSPKVVTTVTPQADLQITKSAAATVAATSNLVYTISVTNVGPSTAGSVTVTDAIPTGATFVNASGGGANNSGIVTWNFGNLVNGAISNVTLTVAAPANGFLTNIATVGSPTGDPSLVNNTSAPVITAITPKADLQIGKSAAATVAATSNLVYTISVTNVGPSIASSVTVTDAIPTGATFVSASGGGANNSGIVTWNFGNLVNGAISNVTLTVTAPANGSLTNLATVGSPTGDPSLINNTSAPVITTITPKADLQITKSAAATVTATSNLVYTISVTNIGPSTASSVTVTDSLPTGATFVNASGGGANNSGIVTWNFGSLASATASNVTLTVAAPANGSITNIATVGSPTGDPSLINNTSAPVITTITPQADVQIGKTAAATVAATSNLVYTISVTNVGPSTASSVTVTDAVPTGATFVNASGGGANNSGIVTWNFGNLVNGAISNVTLTVAAPANGSLTNLATVGSPTGDPSLINNTSAPVITTITPQADVQIGKTAVATVAATSNLVYTISVTNMGPSIASSVTVTDAVPTGATFVNASGGGANNSGIVTWNFGNLVNGAISNVTLTVTAPANGSLTNLATVGSPTGDPTLINNTSAPVVTTIIPQADVQIGKTALATVLATSNLVYTISVTNVGPSIASSVTVTDAIPAGAAFVGASGGGVNNSGIVTWNFGNLINGAISNVTLTVTAPTSGSLTNIATVGSPTGDPSLINNTSAPVITTITPQADVQIGKTAAATVLAASNLVYTISVTNFGPSTASSVTVTDSVPTGATFVSASGGGVNNSGVVTWSLGNLVNGAISNVTLTVTAPVSGSLTNIATAGSPTGDPNLTNNTTPPVVTTVTPVADLGIAKSGPAFVAAAGTVNYTISVTNFGPSSAGGVLVTDTLPVGVTFTSASGGGVNNSGVVNWTLGTMTAGQVSNLTVSVVAPASGTLTNIASVWSPTVDTNTLNNTTPPVVTTVTLLADLAVGKTAPATVQATSNLVYTILVTNLGPSTANSVTVTDAVPVGATFVSASGGGANNSGIVTWSLGNLVNGAISNVTLTVTAPANGSSTNIATVGSPTGDPSFLNNTSAPVITAIIPEADVQIGKTAAASVLASSNLVYTISVTNFGPSTASSVTVTDAIPAGATFVSASGGGANNTGVVTWNFGNLANGAISNVTLTVTAPASGSLTNIATLGSPTGDPNLTNNTTPPVISTVTPLADVSVVKTGPAGVTFGTNFNYTITVSNAGPSTASGILVTDSLPVGLVFVSSVPATTTNAVGQVIWSLGNFAANTGSNLTLTVISTQRGSLTNLASGGSPTLDPVPTNNPAPPVVTLVTNIPPLPIPDSYAITENTTNTFSPLINDLVRTPGGYLTLTFINPANGIGAVVNQTNVVFMPTNNFLGITLIGYTITDNVGGTNSSFINVLVTNIPPVATPDNFAITENTTNLFPVLANDFAVTPGGSVSLVSVSTTNGTVSVNGTNVVFTPATNYLGTVTLNYTVTDNVGGTNTSTVTVLITNIPPVANPDTYTVTENSTNTFTPLVNDLVETPGGFLTLVSLNNTNGTATILNGTNVVFTPANNFVGTATIGYTITDNVGGTNSSTITVTVSNLPPTAFGQSVSTPENTPLPITLTGNDPTSLPLTYIIVSGPAGGTLTGLNTNTGAVTYTPTNNFTGTDSFTFHVNNGFNNSSNATITIAVAPVADLLVAQSGPASGAAGVNLTYTVAVTNLGPAGATNILVTNQLAQGFTYVSATASGVTNNIGQVIWTVPVLAPNAATNLTVTLFATEGGTYTNIASGISATLDLNATNNNGTLSNAVVVTTVSALADVAVFKTGNTSVVAGGTVNYSIVATNIGPSTASNVVVSDTLPAGATLQTASGNYSLNSGVITWAAANLHGGTATNFMVTVTAPFNGTMTNIASSTSDTADPVPGNNDGSSPSSVVITPVTTTADLAIGKSAVASVLATSNVVYTIAVTNLGPSIASSVTVTDAVPAGATFVSASNGGVTNAGIVTWSLGSMASGAVSNLTLTVTAPVSGSLTNIASVGSPTGDPNLTNNLTPPVITTVTPVADVGIGKSGPAAATFNTNIVYTISVTNFGPSTASGILVTDSLPVGVAFVSAVPVTSTNALGQVIWSLGNLAAGSTSNLTLTVVSTTLGSVTNLASIGSPTLDPSLTNNISQPVVSLVTNIPPIANPDTYSVTENGGTNTFSPLINDLVRNPGGTLSLVSVSTTNGSAITSGTNVLFIPATNYFGTVTLNYTITDNVGGTNSTTITVLVTNIAPVANPDTYTVAENSGTAALSPLVNDVVHTSGGVLSLVSVSGTNGNASISGTNVLFTPTVNFFGTATIGYTITDGIGGFSTSLITVNVTNVPPVANPQAVNTAENVPVVITLTGTDPNSLPLTFSIVGNPTNGTLSGLNSGTGTVTYTPNTNYTGADSFTFRVNNGQTNSTPATVNLSVIPAADLVVVESGPATALAGSNLVFTVSVTNRGPATATSLLISNKLAAGYTFLSASSGGVHNGNLVTWSFPSLAPNAVTNFTVTAFATEGGSYTNIASGTSAVLDLNPANNDGSQVNAKSVTVLTPVVDLVVYKDGGTNVYAGTLVNYTITASNAGPSTATSVAVQDTLPAGGSFQSATGTYTQSNGVVTWNSFSLAPGAVATFNLTLLASPSVTSFINIASGTNAEYDPNPTNNNGTYAKSRVTTKVTPSADMIAAISGPTNAIIGSNIVFTLTLTNAGPSTASNVVASDVLPTSLIFVSASNGATNSNGTNGGGIITWPAIISFPAGYYTNFTFTVKAHTLGTFTNVVSAISSTYDPNPTNNTGVLPNAQAQTQVTLPQFTLLAGLPVLNPQTGLYEEQVTVTNSGNVTVAGIQLYTGGLRSGVSLYNAAGTNGGVPYVQYAFPLDPSSTVHFVLEFYNPSRLAFTNSLYVVAYVPANNTTAGTNNSIAVNTVFADLRSNPPRIVIEWASTPGTTYLVLYASSPTATTWNIATPSITATANITQWYDDGPPKTASAPLSVGTRYYRVIKY